MYESEINPQFPQSPKKTPHFKLHKYDVCSTMIKMDYFVWCPCCSDWEIWHCEVLPRETNTHTSRIAGAAFRWMTLKVRVLHLNVRTVSHTRLHHTYVQIIASTSCMDDTTMAQNNLRKKHFAFNLLAFHSLDREAQIPYHICVIWVILKKKKSTCIRATVVCS